MKILGALLFIIAIFIWISLGIGDFRIGRDTDAVLERAQVAANAQDMQEYVLQLKKNMAARGMTNGHATIVFKTPQNDMGLIYKTVARVNERLEAIKDTPQSETTYQVALDDLRGTVRELDLNVGGWFWAHNWWVLGLSILMVIAALICLTGSSQEE